VVGGDGYSSGDRSDDEEPTGHHPHYPAAAATGASAAATPDDEGADNDFSVPLSVGRRRALLAVFDSSFSLCNYRGRLGFLFHPLSSASASSCLYSPAEARHVEWMLRALLEEMQWMRASVSWRDAFATALHGHPVLKFVPKE